MLILGLTGTFSSGKGEVGKYLVQKGFTYYSCSDELRKEAKKLGLPETRENLGIVIGDRLRREFGKGVLAKRIYEQILKEKKEFAVVDSLRNIEEENETKGENTLMKMENCFKEADFKIINDGILNELHKKIDDILEKVDHGNF